LGLIITCGLAPLYFFAKKGLIYIFLYCIYIKENKIPENLMEYLDSNYKIIRNNVDYVLYTITDKIEYAMKFISFRKEIFIINKIKINKNMIDEFKPYQYLFLDYYKYESKNGYINILSTNFEYMISKIFWYEYLFLYENDYSYLLNKNINILNDEYRDEINKLGIDNCIRFHNKNKIECDINFNLEVYSLNIFIHIFMFTLKKK
jgi:hypothetical protein